MMILLFVDTERVWRGGQDQLFTLLRGLIDRHHQVHLACHPGTLLEERARQIGVGVHPLRIWSEIDPVFFVRFLRVVRRVRPQILAFNTPRAILAGNMASRFSTVKARLVFRRVNFPLRRNALTRLKYNRGVDCIVAISESIRSQLQAGGIPPEKIRTIYEGVDLRLYRRRTGPAATEAGRRIRVGTVAYLSPEKGLHHLIDAAALIPEVASRMSFVVVGDGECRAELEERVKLRGLSACFRFAGFQSRPAEYFEAFDIFVLPSLSEGLSSSILTAMATSLPVVATNVGGIPELILHEENGLLVPPGDPEALARAILSLAGDPELRFRMGQAGRTRLEERFTLERKIRDTEQLCASFL